MATENITENANMTKCRTRDTPNGIVFIKCIPSGKLENRCLEAAYAIYDTKTGRRTVKNFIFHHPPSHSVYEDTFADYHMTPSEGDGSTLLQLCKKKETAPHKIQDFCQSLTDDLQETFGSQSRHITFVGDHIWQTRSLLYPFMFCQNPWIELPNKRQLVHFVEFRTFMQPFAVMHIQMGEPFELPRWVFRGKPDVTAQVNYFHSMIDMSIRRMPELQPGDKEAGECDGNCEKECELNENERTPVCGDDNCCRSICNDE
jgi:hypothetical protein